MNPLQQIRDYFRRREDRRPVTQADVVVLKDSMMAYNDAIDGVPDIVRLDGFQSSELGFGTSRDKAEMFSYRDSHRCSRRELNQMYRSSGLLRTIIDLPINDMTRRGFTIEHPAAPNICAMLEALNITPLCNKVGKWGRAFRLGAVVLDIDDGRQVWEPVDVKKIKAINVALALDSSFILPNDFCWWKDTEYYTVTADSSLVVHRDRMLIFNGLDAGIENRLLSGGLFESVVDMVYQPFRNLSVDYNSASTLLKDFSVPVIKLAGFADKLKQNTSQTSADIRQRVSLMRRLLSVINGIVIGETDSYENLTRTVTGYAEIVRLAKEHLCFVAGIPHTKLFKEGTGGGLNNGKGESEDNDWDDIILDLQTTSWQPELRKIITYTGALEGIYTPIPFHFNPLAQLTEKQKAEISKIKAETMKTKLEGAEIAKRNGWLSDEEVRRNLFILQYGHQADRWVVENDQLPEKKIIPIGDMLDRAGNFELVYNARIAA